MALKIGLVVLPALLAACAVTPDPPSHTVPTIANLSGEPAALKSNMPIPAVRERAIEAYRGYLQHYPDAGARKEVMRRLADLLLESATERLTEGSVAAGNSRPTNSTASERIAEAIEIYEALLRQDAHDERRVELLYQLARAYEGLGQPTRAMTLLSQLPQHPAHAKENLFADAQFRRGELLFGSGSFSAAEQAYRKVVDLGKTTSVYEQSLYKLGWSLFKQHRPRDALDVFITLVDHKLPQGADPTARMATFSRVEREQLADAFRAVSLCLSGMGGVSSVVRYFAQHGGRSYEDRIYHRLGELYLTEERYGDAADTYLALAENHPFSAEAPRLYIRVIEIYEHAGFSKQALETKAAFANRFGPDSGFWRHHLAETMPEVLRYLPVAVGDLARYHHARARQEEDANGYREAEKWYRIYLQSFGDAQQAAEMNFLLAELLYETGQTEQAAKEYERTAYLRGNHPRGGEAGYRAILARAEHRRRLSGRRKESWVEESIANAVRFLETYPTHPKASAVLTMVGGELLALHRQREVIQVSEVFLEERSRFPIELCRQASILFAQAQFALGNYPQAEHAYQAAWQLMAPDDPRRANLRERVAAAIYKQGEESLVNGDARRAAANFLRVASAAPHSPIRPKAEYDAAVAMLTLEEWTAAADMLERFRTVYPDHPLQQQVGQKLAVAYDQGGRVLEAADEYLRLGQRQRDDAVRREAFLQAAALYERADRLGDAISALEAYARQFPRPVADAMEVRLRLARLVHIQGDEARRRYWLKQIIEDNRKAGAERSARTRTLAAQASLQLAQTPVERFRSVRLVEPLQDSLPRKLGEMQRALDELGRAANYGVPSIRNAATYQMAHLYQELSRELLASERPSTLSGEERDQYNRLLEEQALPFKEKAIQFYEANVRRLREGRYDAWIAKSLERLAELVPARYAKEERGEPFIETLQ